MGQTVARNLAHLQEPATMWLGSKATAPCGSGTHLSKRTGMSEQQADLAL